MTNQKSYYRVKLGLKNKYAKECYQGKFIGVRYDGFDFDLSNEILENKQNFKAKFRDIFLKHNPKNDKIGAGLACGAVWTISKGIKRGDIVICPNGRREYWVGKVTSDYSFQADSFIPHQRKVVWLPKIIARSDISQGILNSTNSGDMAVDITKYAKEIDKLISDASQSQRIIDSESIEYASKIESLLKRAKKIAVEYYHLTEKPLGVTAEVGEYLAAKHLGLKLAKVREVGYDAIGTDGRLVQIKSRVTEDGRKNSNLSAIRLDHEWDTVVFVLMDRYFEPKAMYEADRKAVEKALKKPGSISRNVRGQLSITKFIGISQEVWPKTDKSQKKS